MSGFVPSSWKSPLPPDERAQDARDDAELSVSLRRSCRPARNNTYSTMRDQKSEFLTEFNERIDHLPESVDRAAVKRMQIVAYVLDEGIRVPGIGYRIGIDPLLGILPGAGDVLSGGISLYIVAEAARLGVSYATLLKLIANISLDVVVGTIPVVGDVFDIFWKANKRNFKLVIDDLTTDRDRSTRSSSERTEIEIE